MLASSLKEDLERRQLWIRKEIPACPLQLISCQTGTGDLITSLNLPASPTTLLGGEVIQPPCLHYVQLTVFAEAKKIVTRFTD